MMNRDEIDILIAKVAEHGETRDSGFAAVAAALSALLDMAAPPVVSAPAAKPPPPAMPTQAPINKPPVIAPAEGKE